MEKASFYLNKYFVENCSRYFKGFNFVILQIICYEDKNLQGRFYE